MPLFSFYVLIRCRRSSRLKNATPSKQEHARLEVENAEDDLVQKTEVAITLMKAVLDNVRNGFWRNLLFFPLICHCVFTARTH